MFFKFCKDKSPLAHFYFYLVVIKRLIYIKEFENKSGQVGVVYFEEVLGMEINIQIVGNICNSLNGLSRLHRNKCLSNSETQIARDTSSAMELAQIVIWQLWADNKKLRDNQSKTE